MTKSIHDSTPTVSVVVPVYNGERYLEACVRSVLDQTYRQIQLVLVNDGSTDGSGALCDAYARQDPRVRVVHQANQGAAAARKNGILAADGPYVMFVDADDWIHLELAERMVALATEHGSDLVVGRMEVVSGDTVTGYAHRLPTGSYDRARIEREIFPQMMSSDPFFGCGVHPCMWGKLWRKTLVEKNLDALDTGIRFGEDACFVFSAVLDCESLCIDNISGYYYRDNAESITRRFDTRLLDDPEKLRRFFGELVQRKNWDPGDQFEEYMAEIYYNVLRNAFTSTDSNNPALDRALAAYQRDHFPKNFWRLERVRRAPVKVKLRFLAFRYGSIPLVRRLMNWKRRH